MIDRQEVRRLYDAGAERYHRTTLLYRLIGLRMHAYRVQAVDALRLEPGGCVVELGCGTGMNFPLLLERLPSRQRLYIE